VTRLLAILTIGERPRFDDFERQAATIMADYGVRIEQSFAVGSAREAHVVGFAREADFEAYRGDPRLAALAPLRSRGIVATEIYRAAVPDRWHGPSQVYAELIARYCEPHRRYHTVQHLEECFLKLNDVRSLAPRPEEIESALWFHDAIYDTRRHDNEERSAQWARTCLGGAAGERVHDLVLTTKHESTPDDADARLLIDVDLSILAAPEERFDEYEVQIREEYGWVPEFIYRRERRRILAGFLSRERIFSTAAFNERQARANLVRAIAKL